MTLNAITMAIKHTPEPATARKSVTLLGATGTIGQNTLKILAAHPERFDLTAITAGDNVTLLAEQARTFRPKRAVIANTDLYSALKDALKGTGIEAAAGVDAVCEAAAMPSDVVMSAIVGAAGLKPTLAAISSGRTVALANKECLVCAGELVLSEVKKHGATLLPVDSEHSAIFQLFDTKRPEQVESITITASGGPFRSWTTKQMKDATPEQAVKHPNWNMGAKISVDSATLMNKGLELIEAYYLFPLAPEQLKAIIHPQSIVHCLVEMIDGSVLAQLSNPDMCTPIAYALGWPERISAPVAKLDLATIGQLHFEAPDEKRFPALRLAREAMQAGGNAPTVLNAANEVAVSRFLKGAIGFLDIARIVEQTLEALENKPLKNLNDVLACNAQARQFAENI
jgi:1-deoxy-D-xylulose-5-phosphate reductoisomerase